MFVIFSGLFIIAVGSSDHVVLIHVHLARITALMLAYL
jgi:hypothetical protein